MNSPPPALLPTPEEPEAASGALAVLLLAVVQGLAEFLPISSSGHLVLGRSLLGLQEAGLTLDVALHVGTLAAVTYAYRSDVRKLFTDVLAGRLGLAIWLFVATVPVGVVGLLFKDRIEVAASTVAAAGGGLLLTSVLLLLGERARSRNHAAATSGSPEPPEVEEDSEALPGLRFAVLIGLAQCLALWPGVSRSGTTIAAGLMLGLGSSSAARLSFLMSLPAVAGAAVVSLPDAIQEGVAGVGIYWVLAAVVLSALVGILALRLLLLVLHRGAFRWFALYTLVLGVLALSIS